ncbi:hypothetical protein [Nocardia sp. R7R-8]|uniref:hypothetical protein n=1 Tax=Nocardia sp. R7R-8 TaxID=3459304 RepID=UPI00403DC31B
MTDPSFDIQAANDISMSVCEIIIRSYREVEWDSLALVANLDGAASMYGYTYTDNGEFSANVPAGVGFLEKMKEFREATGVRGENDWKACLIQIKRADMSLNVEYEYDDADRWRVTPDNYAQRIEELRPQ